MWKKIKKGTSCMTRYRIQIEQFIILAGKKKKFILDAGALQSHFFSVFKYSIF